MLLYFDPHGTGTSTAMLNRYSDVGFVDGTLGTSFGTMASPFTSTSGTPVQGFQFRVVSCSVTITPLMPLTQQSGLITYGFIPGALPTSLTTWDNIRDFPGVKMVSGVNKVIIKYEP